MIQLIQNKRSFTELVQWLRVFISFPAEDNHAENKDWEKRISTQAMSLMKIKTKLQKPTSVDGKKKFEEWENTKYVLPIKAGPRPQKNTRTFIN